MLFNSYFFIFVFLPVSLLGFFVAARLGRQPAALWLVGASFVFYGWWNYAFLPVLVVSIGFNYVMAELITRWPDRPHWQTAILSIAIAVNLTALFYFKYAFAVADFFTAHRIVSIPLDPIVLPLGISFFTFTQIGYLIDLKQGTAQERGFLNYALFASFFPHLIAGPILHNREMMPQFADPKVYRFSADNLAIGSAIFVLGLVKKTVLADPLAESVAAGFAHPGTLALFDAWHVSLSYTLQLYFDFSGYSDMAIGLARMFNIVFPLNFDSPFKSPSVIEFWQRWHMTLTRYLTLYLYNPMALSVVRWRAARQLGTTRKAHATFGGFASMVALPTITTMFLAGIWHGAGLQFVVFGVLHGFYLTINHLWRTFRPLSAAEALKSDYGKIFRPASILLTYLCVMVGMIFFRSSSVGDAMQMLGGMIGLHGGDAHFPISGQNLVRLACLFVVVWSLPNTQQIMERFGPALGHIRANSLPRLSWQGNIGWGIALGVGFAFALMAMGGTTEFLYFQF